MDKLKERSYYLITFILCMVFRLFMISGNQMRIISDCIGMLSSPAYLAGYDWSNVVARSKYYGAAYYILFTPVLKFIDDPCTVWAVLLISNVVLEALTCVLSYHIAVRYLRFEARLLTSLIAVLSSQVIQSSTLLMQESALFFLTWLIALILLKLNETRQKDAKLYFYSAMLSFLCAYAYLVHSRAVVFIVALFPTLILMTHYERKKIKCLFCFTGTLLISMLLAKVMQNVVISTLWNGQEGLENVGFPISSSTFINMLSLTGIRVLIDMIVSNLFTSAVRLSGANIIVIILGIMLVIGVKRKKFSVDIMQGEKLLLAYSLICYMVGVIGVAVIWGKAIVPVYFTDGITNNYKGFAYYRYYASFFGPAVMVALGECVYNKKLCARLKLPVFISEALIILYYLLFIVQRIEKSQYVNNALFTYFNLEVSGFDNVNFKATITVLIITTFLIFTEVKNKYLKESIILLCIICFYIRFFGNGFIVSPQLNSGGDGGYLLVKYLEQTGSFTSKIYCTNSTQAFYYQYLLKEYSIIVGYPEGGMCEILFSKEGTKTDNIPESFRTIQLDNNEWVWTGNSELYDIIVDYVSWKEG